MDSKKVIIFCNKGGGNTKNLVEESIKNLKNFEIEMLPSNKTDISSYDYIGFASGIYYMDFSKDIYDHIEKLTLDGKKCFTMISSGANLEKFISYPKNAIEKKGGKFIGGFGCKGPQTFFLFKWISYLFGGATTIDKKDLEKGKEFINDLLAGKFDNNNNNN